MLCTRCGLEKHEDELAPRDDRPKGAKSWCRKCLAIESRRHHLRRRYGMTCEQYRMMLEEQDHRCFLCGGVNPGGKQLFVDHNHTTGMIRKLLCGNCNRLVGNYEQLKSDPGLHKRLEEYCGYGIKVVP